MPSISKTYHPLLQFNAIGETKDFSIEVPLRGWNQLSSISVNGTGITSSRYTDIYVSYTIDGINYSNYQSISTITVPIKSDFIVKVRLIRAGVDTSGVIVINSIVLNGNYMQSYYDVWNMSGTMFSDVLYEDERWNKLWINLLTKIYKEGIVPEFIERGADVYPADKDYIEFWKYQCMFWALSVELAFRKIEGVLENKEDLISYLKQKTVLLCEEHAQLDELQFICENLWDEIRQRGTHMIHYKNNVPLGGGATTYTIPYNIEKPINGELLRYLCFDRLKEFVYAYYPRHLSGWTLDLTSPNYFGYTEQIQINKAPEFTQDFESLDGFTVYNDNATYIDNIKFNNILLDDDTSFHLACENGDDLIIDAPSYKALFIGASDIDDTDLLALEDSDGDDFFVLEDSAGYVELEESGLVVDLGIQGNGVKFETVVDAKLSYECTMYVYGMDPNDINTSTSIWIKGWKNNKTDQVALLRADGALPLTLEASVLFQTGPLQSEKMWFLRFNIDSIYGQVDTPDSHTNWNVGNNLRFYDTETSLIEVFILNQGTQDFLIWDLKFRPLKFDNTYGLDNYNTSVLLTHLNNKQITEEQFTTDAIQYLFPYGGGFYFKNLSKPESQFSLLTELGEPIETETSLKVII